MSESLKASLVTIGGREYRLLDWKAHSVLHHVCLLQLIRGIGLDALHPEEGESDVGYFLRLQAALLESGRTLELVAAYLMPLDVAEADWTPATARAIAAEIGGSTADADYEVVFGLAVEAVKGFFFAARSSAGLSRGSLPTPLARRAPDPSWPVR